MTGSQIAEISITKTLVVVVVVFCICYALQVILGIHMCMFLWILLFNPEQKDSFLAEAKASRLFIFISTYEGLMTTINSSINFLIYIAVGNKFRKSFRNLVLTTFGLHDTRNRQSNTRCSTLTNY